MTYADIRAALEANEHRHALNAVSSIRYRMLESRLVRAVDARKEAERKLFDHVCTENDELNRLRAENRRLHVENAALNRALLLQMPAERPAVVPPERPRPKPRVKGASSRLRGSALVQRALRDDPFPAAPEPGTFDPTVTDEDLRDYGQ